MLDTAVSTISPITASQTFALDLPNSAVSGAIQLTQLSAGARSAGILADTASGGVMPALPRLGLDSFALTELAIAAGCMTVATALIVLERKGDIKRPWICALMAAMVLLVGLYHVMNSLGPVPYPVVALLAVATLTMGALFWANLPAMVAGPGPQRFAEAHAILQKEFDRRMSVKEDLRQAHEALQTAHADLERRVVERTAALRAANTEMERFIHVASHDLRAPLRALMVLPGWLRETIQTQHGAVHEDLEIDLREMEVQSHRMERLLCDLRTHARLGQEADPPVDLDLAPLVRRAASEIDLPDMFSLELPPSLPRLHCPPNGVLLLLQIVLSNAVKHHHRAGGIIRISGLRNGSMVQLLIQDDGPGIAAEYDDKIFDMLFTLKPRDEVEGSGMGLATARKCAALAGGSIHLCPPGDNDAGDHGATFCITLPAAIAPIPAPVPQGRGNPILTPAEATL